MFEVGRLVARISLEGAATFGRDLRQVGSEFGKLDDKGREASTRIGSSLAFIGTSIIALASLAIARFASFDKAMSAAGAATGATADEQDRLRKAAIAAGAVTVYTAEQSADGITELGKAGVKTSEILGGGLSGSLALAAAGQISVAEASSVAATAMTQFRLSGAAIPHLADLLANGANKAQGGVSELSMALKQSGLVASQMGLSVDETIGTLTSFASAGLLGSDAGTSFRTMLLSLANPSAEAAKTLEAYNIEAYDAQGNFVGMASLQKQLREGFKGTTQEQRNAALATIFGSDAIRAASALYQQGERDIDGWTEAVGEQGAAARVASDLQNNLAGDVEKLGGAIDAALIQTGEGANGVLRDMTKALTGLLEAYGNLPPEVQQFGLFLGIATGAVLLFGGMLLMAVPKILEFRLAMQTLNTQVPALRGNLGKLSAFLSGPWGIALAAAALGVQLLGDYLDSLGASSEEIQASLRTAGEASEIFATLGKGTDAKWMRDVAADLGDLNKVLQAAADQDQNWLLRFDSSNFGAFEALKKAGTELATLAQSDLPAASNAFGVLAAETDGSQSRLWQLLSQMPGFRDELIVQAKTMGLYSESMTEAEKKQVLLDLAMGTSAQQAEFTAGAYDDTSIAVEDVTLSITDLIDALNEVNGVQITAAEAGIRYQDQLARIGEQAMNAQKGVEGYGLGLDITTQAGRDNYGMLLDLAKAGQDVAQANLEAGGTAADYRNELVASREAWIQQAISLGATADEAQRLADKIYNIPSAKEIAITVNTDAATSKIGAWVTTMSGLRINLGVDANGRPVNKGNFADGGRVEYYAGGGMRENHIAQIARAGATRVWAEPETEGEIYAPMALSKRAQSLAIIGQAVNEWGYDLVPKSAGSRSASTPGTGGPATAGINVIVASKGGVDLLKYIDVSVEERFDDVASEISGGIQQ